MHYTETAYECTTKTPLKVILSGEHSVVYGEPAISCGINSFTRGAFNVKITVYPNENEKLISVANTRNNVSTNFMLLSVNIKAQDATGSSAIVSFSSIPLSLCEDSPIEYTEEKIKQFSDIEKAFLAAARKYFLMHWMRYSPSFTEVYEKLPKINIMCTGTISVDAPFASGLGTSASILATFLKALYIKRIFSLITIESFKAIPNNSIAVTHEILFDSVQAGESVFHGTPSGIDAFTVLSGNICVCIVEETVAVNLRELLPADKTIISLSRNGRRFFSFSPRIIPLLRSNNSFYIKWTGQPKSSRSIISHIAALSSESREQIVKSIGIITLEILKIYFYSAQPIYLTKEKGDINNSRLREHIIQNQELLRQLGASTYEIDKATLALSEKEDCFAAKLSGSGGGGCVIGFRDLSQLMITETSVDAEQEQQPCLISNSKEVLCSIVEGVTLIDRNEY